MSTRNVDIPEHFDRFIELGVSSGRFSDVNEMVREGLRSVEQQQNEDDSKLEWLRAAAKEGFDCMDRGDYVVLHSPEETPEFLREIREEVFAELAAEEKLGVKSKPDKCSACQGSARSEAKRTGRLLRSLCAFFCVSGA